VPGRLRGSERIAGIGDLPCRDEVSAVYLVATVIATAAARERGGLEVLANISQMTVSQMRLTEMTGSPQPRRHLLAELVLNWSGVPVVHARSTVFLWAASRVSPGASTSYL
jgi:hypothetical protein